MGSLDEEHDTHLSYISDPSLHPEHAWSHKNARTGKAETSPLDSRPECWTYVSNFRFSPQKNLGLKVLPIMPHWVGGMGLQQVSAMSLLTSFDVGTELLTSSWIFHKRNWSVYCLWVSVSLGEGRSRTCPSTILLTSSQFYPFLT